jgi:uracil-DNA glycosylase
MEKIDPILKKLNSCNERCKSIVIDREKGVIPRWIGGNTDNPDLMIVGLNPGKCDTTERFLYKEFLQKDSRLIVKFTDHCLKDPGSQKDNYLNKLMNLLKEIFGGDFLKKVYITNVAKCESEVNGVVAPETKQHCYKEFLKEEIETLKPKLILALGKEVHLFLRNSGYENVIKCLHPSPLNVSSKKFWTVSSVERKALIQEIRTRLSI